MKTTLLYVFGIICILLISMRCSSNATIAVARPTVDFEIANDSCQAPCVVRFTNLTREAIEYEWDFGNGTTSTAFSPSILYDQRGTYTVTLTATNAGGTSRLSKEVTILP